MRNFYFPVWVLLLVDGVFGYKVTVSVMKGDSVTLHTNVNGLKNDDTIDWKDAHDVLIARIKNNKILNVPPEGTLDTQTGSLTIRNVTESRLYKLDIELGKQTFKEFDVTVHDNVESIPVMEGDSVILHINVTKIQRDDQIQWKFGEQGTPIARLNGAVDDSKWSNVHLNDQTGDLNITNIRNDQYNDYKVEISTSRMILHRKFRFKSIGGAKTVSVKKGESISLHTGVTDIQDYDQILWKFQDNLIAEIRKEIKLFLVHDIVDERFKGRLQLHHQSGTINISNSETTDSGVYHLNMSSSSHNLQRKISVTVNDSGLSWAVIAVICLSAVLVVGVGFGVGVAIWLARRNCDRAVQNDSNPPESMTMIRNDENLQLSPI